MSDNAKKKKKKAADADAAVPAADETRVDVSTPAAAARPEDQSARWVKYGSNVALSSVVVIALAAIAVWASQGTTNATQKLRARADLTSDGSNALKPQTLALLRDLPKEVTLVSLYPKLKEEETAAKGTDTHAKVLDILDAYRRAGSKIKVEAIDPVAEPAKLKSWLADVKARYGTEVPAYEAFLKNDVPTAVADLTKLAEDERTTLQGLNVQLSGLPADEYESTRSALGPLFTAVEELVPSLAEITRQADERVTKEALPDYAGAVRVVRDGPDVAVLPGMMAKGTGVAAVSAMGRQFAETFDQLKSVSAAPAVVRQYAAGAGPRFKAMADRADALLAKAKALPPLKLDEVRRKLFPGRSGGGAPPLAVVAMGESDVRLINDASLWSSGESTGFRGRAADRPKPRFAGEQMLTSAIIGLTQAERPKVAFVRFGGRPATFGPFAYVAERLRNYNFDVIDKDFAPPMGMPPQGPEPTEADLKAATWIVLASEPNPHMAGMGMGGGGVLAEKLKAHLDGGGSALCLVDRQGEDLNAALKDWGIESRPNTIVVHKKIEAANAPASGIVENARRVPVVFVLNEFGDHPITTPLRSLDAAMLFATVVRKADVVPAGVSVTPILPAPTDPQSWGETDLSSFRGDPETGAPPADPTYDAAADVGQPLFMGAAAERQGKGRLVVIGCQTFAMNGLANYVDPDVKARTKSNIIQFPANGELVTNSVFWLARNEKMIALSPTALDSARIAAIEPGKLRFIKVGLVMVALPLLAVATGLFVWFSRRG